MFQQSVPKNSANQTPPEAIKTVLYLRSKYHLGSITVACERRINIHDTGTTRILRRNGAGRKPRDTRIHKVDAKHTTSRYQAFIGERGQKVRSLNIRPLTTLRVLER
jgi:hypothetical protein